MASIPALVASSTACLSVAALMFSVTLTASLATLSFCVAFVALSKVTSASIALPTLAASSAMAFKASSFKTSTVLEPEICWASMALIPAAVASSTACLSLAALMFSVACLASLATLSFWIVLVALSKVVSASISFDTLAASSAMAFKASSFKTSTVFEPATCCASMASIPALVASSTPCLSVAALMFSVALVASLVTLFFWIALVVLSKVASLSIAFDTLAASSAIAFRASSFKTSTVFEPETCWASIAWMPAFVASSTACLSVAALMLSVALAASLITLSFWIALVALSKVASTSISLLILAASSAIALRASSFKTGTALEPETCCASMASTPALVASFTPCLSVAELICSLALVASLATLSFWTVLVALSKVASASMSLDTLAASSAIAFRASSFKTSTVFEPAMCCASIASIPALVASSTACLSVAALMFSVAFVASLITLSFWTALVALSKVASLSIDFDTLSASSAMAFRASSFRTSTVFEPAICCASIASIPAVVASSTPCLSVAALMFSVAFVASLITLSFWTALVALSKVASASMSLDTLAASSAIAFRASSFKTSTVFDPDTCWASIASMPALVASSTVCLSVAALMLSVALAVSLATLSFWIALVALSKVASLSIAWLTLAASSAIACNASSFKTGTVFESETCWASMASIPAFVASSTACLSVAALILSVAFVASLATLSFCTALVALSKVASASMSLDTLAASSAMAFRASSFKTSTVLEPAMCCASMASIPALVASSTPCLSLADLIFSVACLASLATLSFWTALVALSNVVSASMALLTLATSSAIALRASSFKTGTVLEPETCCASMASIPALVASSTPCLSVAALMLSVALVASLTTFSFWTALVALSRVASASISFDTLTASSAIACNASSFKTGTVFEPETCCASMALIPAAVASSTACLSVAALMFSVALVASLATFSFCVVLVTLSKVASASISFETLAASSAMAFRASSFKTSTVFEPETCWASIAAIPALTALSTACLSLTDLIFSVALAASWATLFFWTALVALSKVLSASIAFDTLAASSAITFKASFFKSWIDLEPAVWHKSIAQIPTVLASSTACLSWARSILLLAFLASSVTAALWAFFSSSSRVTSLWISPLILTASASIAAIAFFFKSSKLTLPGIYWSSIAFKPLILALSIDCLSLAALMLATALLVSSITLFCWVAFSALSKVTSASIIPRIFTSSSAIAFKAAALKSSTDWLPGTCCLSISVIPVLTASIIFWAVSADEILFLASAAAWSTFAFCACLVSLSRVGSLSISAFTFWAWASIVALAARLRSSKVVALGTCWASISFLPATVALITPWAVVAESIFPLALLAASSTLFFCWAFSISLRVLSPSISAFTLVAWASISATACFFWSSSEIAFGTYWPSIAFLPSLVALSTAWASNAWSILFLAAWAILLTFACCSCFWASFNVGSLLIRPAILVASASISALACCFWSAKLSLFGSCWASILAMPLSKAIWTWSALAAKSTFFWALVAATSTLAFWLAFCSLFKVTSWSMSFLTLRASKSNACLAACFWPAKSVGLAICWPSMLIMPVLVASTTPWASAEPSIFFLASVASLSTLATCSAFIWSVRVASPAMSALTLVASWSIATLAAAFCSAREISLGTCWSLMALIPSFWACKIPWAVVAASMLLLAPVAALSTLFFWVFFWLSVKLTSWSMSFLTLAAWASMATLAAVCWSWMEVLPGWYLPSISVIPLFCASKTAWASSATSMFFLAVLAAVMTSFFCAAFWASFNFASSLIWPVTLAASASISAWACCFWSAKDNLLGWCCPSILAIPSLTALATAEASTAWSILPLAAVAAVSTLACWVCFSWLFRVTSPAISALTFLASASICSLPAAFWPSNDVAFGTYWASMAAIPFTWLFKIAWAVVAASIAVSALVASPSTFCFCWALSAANRLLSSSIACLIFFASAAIASLAAFCWSCKETALGWYLPSISIIPAAWAFNTAWAVVAASILSLAVLVAVATSATWAAFWALFRVGSPLICPWTFLASASMAALAWFFRSANEIWLGLYWASISALPTLVALITPWASVAASTWLWALIVATSTACFWAVFSASVKLPSWSILVFTARAWASSSALAACFWPSKEVGLATCWSSMVFLPSLVALIIAWASTAWAILFLAAWAAFSTLAFWFCFCWSSKLGSVSISPRTFWASASITAWASWRCCANDFWAGWCCWLMSALPALVASIIFWALSAWSILFLATWAALVTLAFCVCFSWLFRDGSLSISPLTFWAWASMSALAAAFCSAKDWAGRCCSRTLFLPSVVAWIMASALGLVSIFCLAALAAWSTAVFWFCLAWSLSVLSASISCLTCLASSSICCLAACFWSARAVPAICCWSIFCWPVVVASTTAWASLAWLIAVLAWLAASCTLAFWLFLTSAVKVESLLIAASTLAASPSITFLAASFWPSREILLGTCWLSMSTKPAWVALITAWALVAWSILAKALSVAVLTPAFWTAFSWFVKVLSPSISAWTFWASAWINFLAADWRSLTGTVPAWYLLSISFLPAVVASIIAWALGALSMLDSAAFAALSTSFDWFAFSSSFKRLSALICPLIFWASASMACLAVAFCSSNEVLLAWWALSIAVFPLFRASLIASAFLAWSMSASALWTAVSTTTFWLSFSALDNDGSSSINFLAFCASRLISFFAASLCSFKDLPVTYWAWIAVTPLLVALAISAARLALSIFWMALAASLSTLSFCTNLVALSRVTSLVILAFTSIAVWLITVLLLLM